ncbi:MAG: L,D-transpeptidase family protein [Hyphomicrobiales bacterium]|nr:L,D-transpeptidase family protein [Hyphomicrobiales bacterium]
MIGLAGSSNEALAQFLPPGPPVAVPSPFRTLPPPAAVEDDDDLPPYDPPPGYRAPTDSGPYPQPPGYRAPAAGQSGPYAQPPRTYQQETLPPPGSYSAGYPQEPAYGPPPGYEPPRGPALRPQYGAVPQQPGDGLRPPAAVGPGQPDTADPDINSRLPMDVRPESGPRKELPPQFRRTTVDYRTREPAGTIVIDTAKTYLYLVLGNGKAMRYGIGVGREGFTWSGAERVSRMAEWPDWHPPAEMIERQPYLPRFMAGGEGNPLGARALYLGKTLYRIHGTNQPSTIGSFVSSGCIRLTNEDIIDLYYRVKVGTRVVVLPGKPPATAAHVPQPLPQASQRPPEPEGEPIPLQPPGIIPAR